MTFRRGGRALMAAWGYGLTAAGLAATVLAGALTLAEAAPQDDTAVLRQEGGLDPSASVFSGADDDAPVWRRGDVLILRGLDKVTAETRDFEVRLGEQARFGMLTVFMPTPCAKRPPEETPQTWAGLEIYERQTDGSGADIAPRLVFSGWMLAESPALHPLQHAVFDVWPLDCITPDPLDDPVLPQP